MIQFILNIIFFILLLGATFRIQELENKVTILEKHRIKDLTTKSNNP